ncbi:inorganic diphosphatase [Lichenibacterium minor]|uniref:inorganic diphosphatase n=1 Tax=Lichenibacterium minor TaxID=2316528 RepID=A0A4Q2UB55_9HYPH|nr:inorganic diphosphatase [Lichenibacterium minor]RYC33993.1 inorganic diphosphatase [Lichenibacterium minor]
MSPAPRTLADLPAFDHDRITVVIETPKGSPNKYGYDHGLAAFRLNAVLPEGTVFPFDFGFVPSTLGEDGDPMDVLVFLDAPTPVGCIIATRLIGVIAVRQKEDGRWISNDRLLAVAAQSHTSGHIETLDDLRPHLLDEIEAFFRHYVGLQGREIEIGERGGPGRARELLEAGMARACGRR